MPSFCLHRSVILVLLVILSVAQSALDASDWPTFRGNNARTAATDESVLFRLNVAWKYESSALAGNGLDRRQGTSF